MKSTVLAGFITRIRKEYDTDNVIFFSEFRHEGQSLYDNLHSCRIIAGEPSECAQVFANLLLQGAIKKDVDILFTDADEAEAIKLFANTYPAMRFAFLTN